MTTTAPVPVPPAPAATFRYGALVVTMALSFVLVTAEFLPNGVLTDIAGGLGITAGQAGQAVTVTALVGLFVAPTVGAVFPRLDRRALLMWAALAAGASNLLVAVAPNLVVLLLARVLLGAAIGGFWTMSITVAARLAPPERIGRAIMFTSAGVSLASVAGVPIGVLMSEVMDWRAVFAVAGVTTTLLAVAIRLVLPSVPAAAHSSSLRLLIDTVRRPGVGLGLAGHVLVVFGHILAYTYIRVALERIPDVDAMTIVVLLALFGFGGLIGNIVIGMVIDRAFALVATVVPVAIAVMVVVTVLLPGSVVVLGVAATAWGFFFASWLIVVNGWVGHRMPDRLEAGGSLVVVGFQAAITVAAAVGGLLVDAFGVTVDFLMGAVLLLIGAALFGSAARRSR